MFPQFLYLELRKDNLPFSFSSPSFSFFFHHHHAFSGKKRERNLALLDAGCTTTQQCSPVFRVLAMRSGDTVFKIRSDHLTLLQYVRVIGLPLGVTRFIPLVCCWRA